MKKMTVVNIEAGILEFLAEKKIVYDFSVWDMAQHIFNYIKE